MIFILISVYLIKVASTFPIDDRNFELTANYFQGDMILSEELTRLLLETPKQNTRKARHTMIDKKFRWPNRTVEYQISKKFSSTEIQWIKKAMHEISSSTCVVFKEISKVSTKSKRTFIFLQPNKNGCSANVGYQRKGVQFINLVPMGAASVGCFRLGTIIHELMHALGVYHQHSSADRDNFVRIHRANIKAGREHNFRKLPANFATSLGIGYDYESVMHYGAFAFSLNGKATIEPLKKFASQIIGQRKNLSPKDILKIRKMYKC